VVPHNSLHEPHLKAEKIGKALALLLSENPPKIDRIELVTGGKGRPLTTYKLIHLAEKAEKIKNPETRAEHGLQENKPSGLNAEKMRKKSKDKIVCDLVRI